MPAAPAQPVTQAWMAPQFFGWPVNGQIAAPYGSLRDGVTLRGIEIETPAGSEVRAAADGRVSFVDPHLKGYGQTLIVEHGGGYHTVYARVSQILVTLGQQVRSGQVIARMGSEKARPVLYFEIRKNSRPEPPLDHLQRR
jgi:septal ring factor EnvC (AmiA/AmiB activator)